jgi:predicted small metal-binding protein
MKEFSCGDVVPGCTVKFRASSNDEILSAVAAHAKNDHGLTSVSAELVGQVIEHIHDAPAA